MSFNGLPKQSSYNNSKKRKFRFKHIYKDTLLLGVLSLISGVVLLFLFPGKNRLASLGNLLMALSFLFFILAPIFSPFKYLSKQIARLDNSQLSRRKIHNIKVIWFAGQLFLVSGLLSMVLSFDSNGIATISPQAGFVLMILGYICTYYSVFSLPWRKRRNSAPAIRRKQD